MTRRSGAAKALVEQPGSGLPRAHGSPGRRGQFGHPARPSRRAHGPPHRPVPGAHLTSTTGRSRTAARRDAVTVAVCNAVLRRPSDPEIAGGAYRLCAGDPLSAGIVGGVQIHQFWPSSVLVINRPMVSTPFEN